MILQPTLFCAVNLAQTGAPITLESGYADESDSISSGIIATPTVVGRVIMSCVTGDVRLFSARTCRVQTSLIAGTLFQVIHLALTLWFLAIYLISQAKTGLSALAFKPHLGVSYPTAWLIQDKLMQTMTERDAQYTLYGERVGR